MTQSLHLAKTKSTQSSSKAMFVFSIPELLVIVTVGLVVLGPKQSLELSLNIAKAFNKIKSEIKSVQDNIKAQINECDLKDSVQQVSQDVRQKLNNVILDNQSKQITLNITQDIDSKPHTESSMNCNIEELEAKLNAIEKQIETLKAHGTCR